MIRAEHEITSQKTGRLLVGSVVYVLETREREGTRRVSVALRDNGKSCGWVTAAKEGEHFLEIEGGAMNQHKEKEEKDKEKQKAGKAAQAAERKGADPETIHYTEAELHKLAETQLKMADEVEESLKTSATSLPVALGEALRQLPNTIAELVASWDLGDSNKVTKFEFRRSVRQLVKNVGTESSVPIDTLFDAIDVAKEARVEINAVKQAFADLKHTAKTRVGTSAKAQQRAVTLRAHAEQTRKSAAATAAAEAAEAALTRLREKPKVDARLGTLLAKRQVKIGDMMSSWDTDGDGQVSQKEFVTQLKQLGVDATSEELEAFFVQLDEDGSGTLELDELGKSLKTLQEAKSHGAEDEKVMMKRAADLRKQARQAIIACHRDFEADEEDRVKEEEELEAIEAVKEAAKTQAADQAKAARAERAAKQKEEKAAFEAKIAHKRRDSLASSAHAKSMSPPRPLPGHVSSFA